MTRQIKEAMVPLALASSKWANIIKQTWSESSTSLRSRYIVDLALNESDRTPRSSTSARIPSPAIPGRVSPHPSPLSFKLSLQFKLPKTVKYAQKLNFLCFIDDDAEYRVTSTKKEIQQDLSGNEELPSQVAASVRLMKAAMDVDHEKLLSGDVSFKWQRDFTAFTAVREEFLVHPVGAV
ncbi:hypothetical protein EVAR_31444_1 [Eumeta japonica]|uniref:Uncharacterized protein n=1 Tax=Eumeta variegata TaxID=151549 RepID=A0A4C1UXY0_EUMVA|nr:hypothetical protein EVAR_31444_1 [Eumeta japonica]